MIWMIMNHIKKDIQFQKEQVKNETVKKRLFMQQKRALEQQKRAGGKEVEIRELSSGADSGEIVQMQAETIGKSNEGSS